MCESLKKKNCRFCAFKTRQGCISKSIEEADPERAIRIVQDWSDRNPTNTILDNFNKFYPDAVKAKNGIPHICCAKLGLVEYCGELFSMDCERCKICWHTVAKESEE
jgi:hypothetical protein